MKTALFVACVVTAGSVVLGANTNNPLYVVKEDKVRSVLIGQPTYSKVLPDAAAVATTDPFDGDDKPKHRYYMGTASCAAPLARVTTRTLLRQLYAAASSVVSDRHLAVPGAGYWAQVDFEDGAGKSLARFLLSPVASLVQFGRSGVVGRSPELSHLVYNILQEHAPAALTKWKEEGLERELNSRAFDEFAPLEILVAERPEPRGGTDPFAVRPGAADTNSTTHPLEAIILPEVEFREASITNIVSWLNGKVRTLSPYYHPMPAVVVAVPEAEFKTNGLPDDLGRSVDEFMRPFFVSAVRRTDAIRARLAQSVVTCSARHTSVFEITKISCAVADVPYSVEGRRVVVGGEKVVFRCYAVRLPQWLLAQGNDAVLECTDTGSPLFDRWFKRIVPEQSTLLVLGRNAPDIAEQYRRLEENLQARSAPPAMAGAVEGRTNEARRIRP